MSELPPEDATRPDPSRETGEETESPIRHATNTARQERWQRTRLVLQPEWMTRDMTLLLLARGFMSAARAFAGVLTPIYLALIGFNGLTLGLLFTVVAITSAVLTSAIGLLSDRLGRKFFIVVLPWFAAVAALVFAVSHVVALLFIFAALGSFGRGAGAGSGTVGPYQPAEQAFMADAIPARHRNSLFGRIGFASSLGALLGTGPLTSLPIVLTWLGVSGLQGMAGYQLSFLVMVGIALVAGLLALPITEPPRVARKKPEQQPRAGADVSVRRFRLNLSRRSWFVLLRLGVTNSINGFAVGFFGPFITYWFFKRYGVGPAEVGLLFSIINLVAMAGNLGAAGVARRLGLVRAITITRTLQAVLIVPMVLAPSFWLAGMVYTLRMLVQRIGLPLRQSYVLGVVPSEERATVAAFSNLPSQLTSSASPTLAGYLFDHVALALPFEIGAFFQAFNTLLFFLFFHRLRPPEEQEKTHDT
jgi:MFS family permease